MTTSSYERTRNLHVAFAALLLLLCTTIGLSFVDLGKAHVVVGIGIAVAKTLILATVFMNLLSSSSTVRLASAASLLWLSFFILLVLGDYLTRGWAETQERRLKDADHATSYDRVEYPHDAMAPNRQSW